MSTAVAASTLPSLPALVRRAASALASAGTAAEVLEARDRAAFAYDAAKSASRMQRAKRAHDDVIAATHRAQADALEIEAQAKRRLADEYDSAQARGEVARNGQHRAVPDGNSRASAEDIGLRRKDIHEARRVRDVEREQPGIVRGALDDILDAGDEPTRAALSRTVERKANLRAAVGTASATKEERGHNLYQTPGEAMRTLLALERFGPKVLEPSCGKGAIARPLEDAGYTVLLADLVDYGTVTKDGECAFIVDFLDLTAIEARPDIVTNPPYGGVLNAYVAHALREHQPAKMALLLNLNFLCGFDDPDRNFVMDDNPPARVWVFKRRLPMMHRDGWDGPEAGSRMNTAWFVWERQPDGSYGDTTVMRRVDWKDFEDKPALGPDAARLPDGEIEWVAGEEGAAAEIDGRVIGSVDLRDDHWAWTIYGQALDGKAQKEGAAKAAFVAAWRRLKGGAA